MRYRAVQDDVLIAEMYEQLLLETPATEANISRMIKKYLSREIEVNLRTRREMHNPPFGPGGYFNEEEERLKIIDIYRPMIVRILNRWTPGVQQVIKASGGNPDIFGYKYLNDVKVAIENAVSKTSIKKSYKLAGSENVPLILQTDEYNVYRPKTWEASKKYFGAPVRISLLDGKEKEGAAWCTSSTKRTHFNQYINENHDKLLYFITKPYDKLYAVRIANIFEQRHSPEALYEQWQNSVAMQDYNYTADRLRENLNLKPTDERYKYRQSERHFFEGRIKDLCIHSIAPKQHIIECRNQNNDSIKFHDLFLRLIGGSNKHGVNVLAESEEYINFIKFVVFKP